MKTEPKKFSNISLILMLQVNMLFLPNFLHRKC